MSEWRGRIVCGWCFQVIREAKDPDLMDSHGICSECEQKLEAAS